MKKMANSPSFKSIPEAVSHAAGGCPHGVYTALWEEIAAETDTSDTPENLQRRKALCHLYNYELAIDQCSMPPGVSVYIRPHWEHAGILCIPHSNREWGMNGYTRCVRRETLSSAQQKLEAWYTAESERIRRDNQLHPAERVKHLDALLREYYQHPEDSR